MIVCPYWTWKDSSSAHGTDSSSSSSSKLALQKVSEAPSEWTFALSHPLLFEKDNEKAAAAVTRAPKLQTSMYLDIRPSTSASCVTSISLLGSAKQVELYVGDAAVYHSTIKGVVHESDKDLFHVNISALSSLQSGSIRVKFLSLIDRQKASFSLNALSVSARNNGSGSGVAAGLTSGAASPSSIRENGVDMAFIAQAVCQLVDAKLSPILIRLDAIEGSMLRHEKLIRTLMSAHTSRALSTADPSAISLSSSSLPLPSEAEDAAEQPMAEGVEDVQELRDTAKAIRENAQKVLESSINHI